MGTFFISDNDSSPIISPDVSTENSKSDSFDAYSMSPMVISDHEGRGFLPIKLEMEEESTIRCKRLKLITTTQQCLYVNVPEQSPLGLTLRKTPSFLNLLETKLHQVGFANPVSNSSEGPDVRTQHINAGKTKASNLCTSLLRIGSWERVSRYEGELVAKCYYAKRKLVWEVLENGLKSKIEFPWSNIASLRARLSDDEPETLEIELLGCPLFFRETNPQPRKHTLWKATTDFTGSQASTYRRHFLQFPQGTLQKHYEKLLNTDERLASLGKKPYPLAASPFFGPENQKNNEFSHQLLGCEEKQFLERRISSDNFGNSQNSILSTKLPFLCQHLSIEQPNRETAPPNSGDIYITSTFDVQEMTRMPFLEAMITETNDCIGHDGSITIKNMFPNILSSCLPSFPDFESITDGIYPHRKDKVNATMTEASDETLDVLKRFHQKSVGIESFDPTSEIQTNCNVLFPFGLDADFGSKSEIDGYVNPSYETSCPQGEVSREIFSNYDNFLGNVSSSTSFPVFVKDQVASNEVEKVSKRLQY